MKLSKFLAGVAFFLLGVAFFTTTSLLLLCQKEESFNKTIPETYNPGESGLAAVDPAWLSKFPIIVPIIISDALKQSKGSSTILLPGGKQANGDVAKTRDYIISPSNNSTISDTLNMPAIMWDSLISPCTLKG